jgi:hypothetical protein
LKTLEEKNCGSNELENPDAETSSCNKLLVTSNCSNY